MFFNGLTIIAHPLARDIRTTFKVVRWGTVRKRRKNWRVERIVTDRPGCFQSGNILYMHPELIEKLKQQTTNSTTPEKS